MIGTTISHYKILEKLGEGGMGVVYKAEDMKLKRTVALKFLPPELTRDPEAKERFVHEAQAASALDHPNICIVHEIDEAKSAAGEPGDGQMFIAMACYEGESLKAKIESGPIKIEEALDIAIQVAEGLHEAHEKSIVHRDIKPANVMVTTKGRAKIMDFGLAKLRGQTKLTKEGTTLGTISYISPEQARGEEVDHRTDIWSLGIMVYEMVTGQLPFKGDYEQVVMYSIINEEPEPIAGLRSGVPMELERIVRKCLEKNPAERYQTSLDLLTDFRHLKKDLSTTMAHAVSRQAVRHPARRWVWLAALVVVLVLAVGVVPRLFRPSAKKAVSERKMLAVLPFENLGSPDDEYFADGITEEILTTLARLSRLGVISRSSTIQYKDRQKDIREIGKDLGVDYVLEGSIRWDRSGDISRVRINPQLIRVSDDIHLWAEQYDATLVDIFQVQSEIAEKVVQALQVTLLETERRVLGRQPTRSPEAYTYFLRGNGYFNKSFTEQNLLNAIEMYQKAIDLDPDFALAHAMLSRSHMYLHWYFEVEGEHLIQAESAAEKALQLDANLPEAHLAQAQYYYHGRQDYDRALTELDVAHRLRPNDATVYELTAYIKRRQGKWEEIVANLRSALELNPRWGAGFWDLGYTLMVMRRYQEAETCNNIGFSLIPDKPIYIADRSRLYILWRGDVTKAKEVLQQAMEYVETSELVYEMVDYLIYEGDYAGALELMPTMTVSAVHDSADYYMTKGWIFQLMNEVDQALAYYDSAKVLLENWIRRGEDDGYPWWYGPINYSRVGLTYASLGVKEEAMRRGEMAVELVPIAKDATLGTALLLYLAKIYTAVGEYDRALDHLEYLCSVPAELSVHLLRLDPAWDPLRDRPRFRALIQKYSGESS